MITSILMFISLLLLMIIGFIFLIWFEDYMRYQRCKNSNNRNVDYKVLEAKERKLAIVNLCNSEKNVQNSFKLWVLLNTGIPLCAFSSWEQTSGSYRISELDSLWNEYKIFYYKMINMRELNEHKKLK